MKKTFKLISTISILLFLVFFIAEEFLDYKYLAMEYRNIFVVIYLVTSLQYFRLEVKEKNSIIQDLKLKLSKK
ncbi:hypothetical protein [Mesonia mobilis]|uniref:hypothetical protein n=1 Tax=Mesonia mobilis TaxID=369791 RepID=UPI0026E9BB0F|nr:hypothetical protein [Mesonia mobilis]|tara:strand:+ start:670 stop:888 length:219 start_codon:yes stop_codon:yes gene_type:complete